MKNVLLLLLSFITSSVWATEKIWMPVGSPQVTPSAVLSPTPTLSFAAPQITTTPVPPVPGDDHWISNYPDGKIESEGDHVGGQKDGIWKFYGPDGSECREVEYQKGVLTGTVVLFDEEGGQKFFKNFTDLVQKGLPDGFQLKTVIPYLVDLSGQGDDGIVLLARSADQSVLMVLDEKGGLLGSRQTAGLADDFVFGRVKKDGPLCFGFDSGCDQAVGTCNWEFDLWDGAQLKTVLQYNGWYGKDGAMTLPLFKDVDGNGSNEIVTDNGVFKWNTAKGIFERK